MHLPKIWGDKSPLFPYVPEALLRDEPCGAIHLTTNKNKKLVFSQWLHYLLHSTTNSYCNFYTWSVSIFEKFLNNYKWVNWFFREEILLLNSSKSWFTKVKLWFLILHILYFSWDLKYELIFKCFGAQVLSIISIIFWSSFFLDNCYQVCNPISVLKFLTRKHQDFILFKFINKSSKHF